MEQLGQEDPNSGQRLAWFMLLMAVLFGVWMVFEKPQKPPAAEGKQAVTKSTEAKKAGGTEAKAAPAKVEPEAPEGKVVPAAVEGASKQLITLENEDLKLEFSNVGGVIEKAALQKYHLKNQPPDDLVSPLSGATGRFPLDIRTGDKAYNELVNTAVFHVERSRTKTGAERVVMSWADGKGNAVTKTLTLPAKGYVAELSITAVQGGKSLEPVPVAWGPGFGKLLEKEAKNRYYEQEYVGLNEAGSFKKIKRSKVSEKHPLVTDTYGEKGPINWAAITDNYFAAIFMPEKPISWVHILTRELSPAERKIHPADTDISLVVPIPGKAKLFMGPKQWKLLSSMDQQMNKLTGWGILSPLCAVLLWALKKLYGFCGNYGVAILLLTLIIKLAFYPLTQKSMVKMKEMGEQMKRVKPQIDRLKAKYKKMGKDMSTRTKMNEEMMALYQREGINPMGNLGGCLPMLIQMPIFFALFEMLPRTIELRSAPFYGWIHDLSLPDPYYITPLLMGVSMVVSSKMGSTNMEGASQGMQKMMIWFMPIMFTWICWTAPAGLTLYWLANNVLTIGQQAMINKEVAKRKEAAQKGRNSTPKGPSKPSHG